MQSEKIDQIAAALVKFQAAMPAVPKSANNPFYRSKYAELETVWNTARPHLTEAGLAIAQTTLPSDTPLAVDIETTLMHTSGQWISGRLTVPYGLEGKAAEGREPKNDPQGMGIAISYGRRYALGAILSIVTDDDGDAQPREASKPKARPAPKPTRQAPAPDGAIPADPPLCPVCEGEMWDNRDKAQGTNKPRWKCKAATWDQETRTSGGCPGVVWRSDPLNDEKYVAAWSGKSKKASPAPPPKPEAAPLDDTDALRLRCRRTLAESLVAAGVNPKVQPSKVARLLANQFSKEKLDELDHGELAGIVQGINSVDWDSCRMEIPFRKETACRT